MAQGVPALRGEDGADALSGSDECVSGEDEDPTPLVLVE